MDSRCVIDTPLGHYAIRAEDGCITCIDRTDAPLCPPTDPLLMEAARQLTAYFSGTLMVFDLPLHTEGTAFQERCWAVLREIPYGETISYGEQARRSGSMKACRAVGGANRRNPIAIVIPCHRVIGANGAMTGYGGSAPDGLAVKQWLLDHERRHCTPHAKEGGASR